MLADQKTPPTTTSFSSNFEDKEVAKYDNYKIFYMQNKKGACQEESLVAEEAHHRVTEEDSSNDDEIIVFTNVSLMGGDVVSGNKFEQFC